MIYCILAAHCPAGQGLWASEETVSVRGVIVTLLPKDTAEVGRPKTTLTSDTNCKFEQTTKTTYGFNNNSLEKLMKLMESCCTHRYGLLQWKEADWN